MTMTYKVRHKNRPPSSVVSSIDAERRAASRDAYTACSTYQLLMFDSAELRKDGHHRAAQKVENAAWVLRFADLKAWVRRPRQTANRKSAR